MNHAEELATTAFVREEINKALAMEKSARVPWGSLLALGGLGGLGYGMLSGRLPEWWRRVTERAATEQQAVEEIGREAAARQEARATRGRILPGMLMGAGLAAGSGPVARVLERAVAAGHLAPRARERYLTQLLAQRGASAEYQALRNALEEIAKRQGLITAKGESQLDISQMLKRLHRFATRKPMGAERTLTEAIRGALGRAPKHLRPEASQFLEDIYGEMARSFTRGGKGRPTVLPRAARRLGGAVRWGGRGLGSALMLATLLPALFQEEPGKPIGGIE